MTTSMTDEQKARAEISAEVFGDSAEKPPEQTEPPQSESEPTPAVEAKPDDEWAGVSPALRSRFERMQSDLAGMSVLEARLKQSEQRIGGLTNELRDARKVETPKPKEEATPEPEEIPESARLFAETYPELAKPIDERFAAVRADLMKRFPRIDEDALQKKVADQVKADMKAEVKAEIARELAVERVEEAHPKFQETLQSAEFLAWRKTATPELQQEATTVPAAIRILDAFEASKKAQKSAADIEATRKKRLEQAQATPGRTLPAAKSQADMTPAELRAAVAREVFG